MDFSAALLLAGHVEVLFCKLSQVSKLVICLETIYERCGCSIRNTIRVIKEYRNPHASFSEKYAYSTVLKTANHFFSKAKSQKNAFGLVLYVNYLFAFASCDRRLYIIVRTVQ